MRIGVPKETAAGERRVALVPEVVAKLVEAGHEIVVERGAGSAASFEDSEYEQAGATLADSAWDTDLVAKVQKPSVEEAARLKQGAVLIGFLEPLTDQEGIERLTGQGVVAFAMESIPRITRAQSMDALSSQATVGGYKATLIAADNLPRFLPMLTTAAGTVQPAKVLVIGAGVAGLQALATARRLGAVTWGFDVRDVVREQIESVGARFLRLASVAPAEGEGGYARVLTAREQAAQQAELAAQIARFDIVITTAQVPGRRPPLLVTAEAVKGMQAGSVLVDLAASRLGGNIEGSVADQAVLTGDGVRIIGAGNLPAQVPTAASTAYSHNIVALLAELVREGALRIDPADDIQAGVVVTHQGTVVHPAVAALLGSPAEGGSR